MSCFSRCFSVLLLGFLLFACEDTWQLETNLFSVCDILDTNPDWYDALVTTEKKWGISKGFLLATIYQESRFYADAKSKRSSAFGFAQAQKGAWSDFLRETKFVEGRPDDFYTALNFIAWYTHKTIKATDIKPDDYKSLYLAYHEGRAGYLAGNHFEEGKEWLLQVSGQVDVLARAYDANMDNCWIF